MSFAIAAISTGLLVAGATIWTSNQNSQAQASAAQAKSDAAKEGMKVINEMTGKAEDSLGYGFDQAQQTIGASTADARDALLKGYGEASLALRDGFSDAITSRDQAWNESRGFLLPYFDTGNRALGAQQDLIGLNGTDAQGRAIDALKTSSMFGELSKQGEDALLQNASATGGVRGGNTQSALATFRPQMLTQLINDQYSRLGGLSATGLNAGSSLASLSGAHGDTISSLLADRGQGISALDTSQGTQLAGLSQQSGQALANLMAQYGLSLSDLYTKTGGNIAQLLGAKGDADASGKGGGVDYLGALTSGLGAGLGVYTGLKKTGAS